MAATDKKRRRLRLPSPARRTKVSIQDFVVITGFSGAGKSQAMACFEDAGYFCVDNLPPEMIASLAELFAHEGSKVERAAVVCDVRGGTYFEVQKREGLYWRRVADDGDWTTRMYWTRVPSARGTTQSTVRIEWRVPPETARGRYRFVYRGNTGVARFQGRSQEFDVRGEDGL